MQDQEVYNSAYLVVAFARSIGPSGKRRGSQDTDEENAAVDLVSSREPSPERRLSIAEPGTPTIQANKQTVVPTAPRKPSVDMAPSARTAMIPLAIVEGLDAFNANQSRPVPGKIQLPHYAPVNFDSRHSRLETVLSMMTPGETPMSLTSPGNNLTSPFFLETGSADADPSQSLQPILMPSPAEQPERSTSPSPAEYARPGRYHTRDPTPSLISGTTGRTSMALSDLPERAGRTISFVSHTSDDEARLRFARASGYDSFVPNHLREGSNGSQHPLRLEPEMISASPARIRPRVRRGISMEPSLPSESVDGNGSVGMRRTSDSSSRPGYGPRRHTTQSGRTFVLKRSESPHMDGTSSIGQSARTPKRLSGSSSQPYSPPMTPHRARSPTQLDSPFYPSSRRTSFNSTVSQSGVRESLKPLIMVKDAKGQQHSYVSISI